MEAGSEKLEAYLKELSRAAEGTFWDFIGCQIGECHREKVVVTLGIQPHHLNLIGILHGGVHAAMIDSAMGIAAMASRPQETVVTTNLHLHYVAPVRQGTVTVTAEIVHSSRRMIHAEARACNDGGELLAFGTGTFRVIEKSPGGGPA
ncbi:PaaI family thioesterase [Paenibacillus aurantius]|uniref:PaaI family thioesterase n=1 Tax=Paenibacillus aurantius TaxID=2918900 RepID=A0AA96LFX6_9BACL|nr:PaaI family thioesterase [Paenibacillus aurantius]WNQ13056.1 PaaI family thioesterase [Paenibacillus aurantius]